MFKVRLFCERCKKEVIEHVKEFNKEQFLMQERPYHICGYYLHYQDHEVEDDDLYYNNAIVKRLDKIIDLLQTSRMMKL